MNELRQQAFKDADAHFPLVEGGQGRTAEEITPDTRICAWWALAILTVAFALPFLCACKKPCCTNPEAALKGLGK